MLIFNRFRPQDVEPHPTSKPEFDCPISITTTKNIFTFCDDFTIRELAIGDAGVRISLCWLDGTVSGSDIAEQVIRPLTDPVRCGSVHKPADVAALLDAGVIYGNDMTRVTAMDDLVRSVAYGGCAIVFDGLAYVFQLKSDQHRSIQSPSIEKSIKGSKDAFVERLRVNTNLVRARLRTPKLKLAQVEVGRKSRTPAAVLWLEGVAAPDLPQEALRRLRGLDVDSLILPDILDSALSDAPISPFPQIIHTERPDKFAASLLDGRIGVLADGIPVGFIAPASLPEFMKTNEDGAQHFITASFIRLLRWTALVLTLLFPALYVAIAMYHAEMIPVQLLLSVIDSKQSVPFSTPAEILGMLVAFELLQEAGLRLPDPVGQTLSIIGALIVGQSAVDAKVISPIAVIVVAAAGIAGYTMPSQDLSTALRLCRFGLSIAAALAGLYGIVMGIAFLIWHLCSIESFGRSYIATPPSGHSEPGLLSVFLRKPPWRDTIRDGDINGGDLRRRA